MGTLDLYARDVLEKWRRGPTIALSSSTSLCSSLCQRPWKGGRLLVQPRVARRQLLRCGGKEKPRAGVNSE